MSHALEIIEIAERNKRYIQGSLNQKTFTCKDFIKTQLCSVKVHGTKIYDSDNNEEKNRVSIYIPNNDSHESHVSSSEKSSSDEAFENIRRKLATIGNTKKYSPRNSKDLSKKLLKQIQKDYKKSNLNNNEIDLYKHHLSEGEENGKREEKKDSSQIENEVINQVIYTEDEESSKEEIILKTKEHNVHSNPEVIKECINEDILESQTNIETREFNDYPHFCIQKLEEIFDKNRKIKDDIDKEPTLSKVVEDHITTSSHDSKNYSIKSKDLVSINLSKEEILFDQNNKLMKNIKLNKVNSSELCKPIKAFTDLRITNIIDITFEDSFFNTESFYYKESLNLIEASIDYRFLIVDDERLIRNTLKRFTAKYAEENKLNIQTVESANGFEGLYVVYSRFNDKKLFNLIICDETMPFMRGSMMINNLTKLIKEDSIYKVPIVSYTSYNDTEKKNFILSQGAQLIENKPISYRNFKIMLKKFL